MVSMHSAHIILAPTLEQLFTEHLILKKGRRLNPFDTPYDPRLVMVYNPVLKNIMTPTSSMPTEILQNTRVLNRHFLAALPIAMEIQLVSALTIL